MAEVTLEPMSQSAYESWRARAVSDYAAQHVTSGSWTPEESLARSQAEFDQLLPAGLATPGHKLWSARSSTGEDVGMLWIATDRRPGLAFIYDIEMDDAHRGEGYGTATLLALEDWCRANGLRSIGLHVFGHNLGAWRLYKRMGYVETNVNMEKKL